MDNTFEYHGGPGKVTEEAFHSISKGQLKVKRYQLKKRMQEGKDKPKHIRHDHWVKLSKLIQEEKKLHEAEKLRHSRAQVRRPSVAGRNEEYVRATLVSVQSFSWRNLHVILLKFVTKPLQLNMTKVVHSLHSADQV